MSRLETLRAELESARTENQRLETENARLVEQKDHADAEVKCEREKLAAVEAERDGLGEDYAQLKTMYEEVLRETQEEQQKAAEETDNAKETIETLRANLQRAERDTVEWEERSTKLRAELQTLTERHELELLRALDKEKARWEAREDRLTTLLEQLQTQLCDKNQQSGPPATLSAPRKTLRLQLPPDHLEFDSTCPQTTNGEGNPLVVAAEESVTISSPVIRASRDLI